MKKILIFLFLFSSVIAFAKGKKDVVVNKKTNKKQQINTNIKTKNNGNNIKDIVVIDNERVDKLIIENYINIKRGDSYNSEIGNQNIKILYETGFFEDVKMIFNEGVLTIKVVENPLISEIIFEGNDKIDDKTLETELSLKKRNMFDKNKMISDVNRILSIYRASGNYSAKVYPEKVEDESNRIKLIFKIDEGEGATIDDIKFIGNKVYSSSELKSEMKSGEWHWYKFGIGSSYNPDALEYDKELIRRLYYTTGYPDFEILSLNADMDKEKENVYVTFLIEEGEKYHFGDISLINNIKKVDTEKLEKISVDKFSMGDVFNSELVQQTIDALNTELAKEGFVFVDIVPNYIKKPDNIMDIEFVINESLRVYVGQIKVVGNTRTFDNIIRQNLRLIEGDPLNLVLLNRSIQELYNTGYFAKVDIKRDKGLMPDTMDLVVEVEERKTGTVSFGIGYSTLDGFNANFGIREDNLLGRGQSLDVTLTLAQYSRDISLNYGKPNFLGRDLYFGSSIFYRQDDDKDSVNYKQEKIGSSVSGTYHITDDIMQRVYYTVYRDKVTDVAQEYQGTITLKNQVASIIGQTIYADMRDNRMNTTSGYYLSYTFEYSGISGDKFYYKNTATANYYIPVYSDSVSLKFGLMGGTIESAKKGQYIEASDAFYLNNSMFRGFRYGGIGPRINYGINSAIGGKKYYVGVSELRFPFGIPKEYNIFGGLFYNFASLFDTDLEGKTLYPIWSDKSVRSAYGLTVYWTTPMGLLNFTFAKPIHKKDYDIPENFNFSFGTNF